jgi:hypothetical protein
LLHGHCPQFDVLRSIKVIKIDEMGWACRMYGGEERRRWEDNIKMDL